MSAPTCDACEKPLVSCRGCGSIGDGPCECDEGEREIRPDAVEQSVETARQTHDSPAEYEGRTVHVSCEDAPWPEVESIRRRQVHRRMRREERDDDN